MAGLVIVVLLAHAVSAGSLLTIDDAVKIARTSHPQVEAARAQLELARAVMSQATAAFLPGLTGEIAYAPQTSNLLPPPGLKRLLTHLSFPGSAQVADVSGNTISTICFRSDACAPPPSFTLPQPSYDLETYWTARVGLALDAWDWGATPYARQAARFGVDAQRYGVTAQENDVALGAKLAYYNLLAVEASVKVAEQAVVTEQLNVDTATQQKKVGVSAEIDVATAQADLAKAQLTVVLTKGAISSAQAALALAMGQQSWRGYTLAPAAEPADEPPPSQDPAIDEAERNRPEPRQLALQARGYEATARSVRGQFLPQLLLEGGPSWTGDSQSTVTNVTISVALSYPVMGLNPFSVRAQMKQAEANRTLTLAQERQTRNEVSDQVATAISDLSTDRQALVAVKVLLDAARERYELAKKSYIAGVSDVVQLSQATLGYIDAQFRLVTTTLNLNQARARLDWALGRP